jgi:hypothetical protein
MAIHITSALETRLRDEMLEQPLEGGEIRRLVGLGRQHIARAGLQLDVT